MPAGPAALVPPAAAIVGSTRMKKSTIAGAAIIALAALSVPVVAWSAGDNDPNPQPQAGEQWSHGGPMHGAMGSQMMHRGWMGRGMRADFSPQQACIDRVARRAGFVAYIGAKLNLTADQKPLWDKVATAAQTAQDNQRQVCATLKPAADQSAPPTVLDRMKRREQMLSAKLQGLQQTEPAVQALYQALSPEQKAILDHPFRRG
jgi:hypothetical protein